MKFPLIAGLAFVVVTAGGTAGLTRQPSSPATELPPTAERVYRAVAERYNQRDAFEIVSFMDQYWRLAGNPGFNASIDHIRGRLTAAGFSAASEGPETLRVEEFANSGRGWDYRAGTVEFEGSSEPALLSRESDRVSLAINSFSTTPGGISAPLVDVQRGTDADYAGKEIKGAVVLGDAPLDRLWKDAVKRRGAAGIISTEIARYIRPAAPAEMSGAQKDVLQWGSVPYDSAVKAFGFKSSWRAADRMRRRLLEGPVRLHVTVDSSFYDGPNRTLIAEIQGRSRPHDRVVMVAHVQEPGANDNGSGCGTLYGLARALLEAIHAGALPRPERTLTFMWVDEVRGTSQWLKTHPVDARGVQYMFALDMTGEDAAKTGGAFLIEKQADPSAVWPRPSDPHTEWGAGTVKAESLRGSLLNDFHLAICGRRARDSGWTVRTNPYEGGSDHTVFADAGTPSLLNWHFTDRYYHTNQDRLEKVSAAEMQNVGIAVATSAWTLASADAPDAIAVVRLISEAATRRLALEREQGGTLLAKAPDRVAAEETERKVRAAWIKWYGEALESVAALPAGGETSSLRTEIAAARTSLTAAASR